jgi:uncharacterized membrane protein YfcA
MNGFEVVWVLSVMLIAALVQSLGGFGFALLAVPLAAMVVDLRTAVVAVSIGSLFNVVVLSWRTRRDINRPLAMRFNLPALIGMPLGLVVLTKADQRPLKIGLGVLIIVATVALIRGAATVQPAKWIDVVAGWLAGVLSTATGTNGPPLVLASQMHRLAPDVFRATLAFTFVVSGSISLALFVASGVVTRPGVALALGAIPLIIVGQRVGLGLQPKLAGRRFDRLVYGLLMLSGLSVGVSGLLAG